MRERKAVLCALVCLGLLFPALAAAQEATTHLVPRDCVSYGGQTPAPPDDSLCSGVAVGLLDGSDLIVSPDGRHLYGVGYEGDAIVTLSRNEETGELSDSGCVGGFGDHVGCGRTGEGLNGITDITISPDGAFVYTTARHDETVATYSRDASSGQLTYVDCISMPSADSPCARSWPRLDEPLAVTISPDGLSAYVAGSYPDSAVSRFTRNPLTGLLTPIDCIADPGARGDCGASQEGLSYVSDVVVSPDGSAVYAVAYSDHAITQFSRAADGSLTGVGCIADVSSSAECGSSVAGLKAARRLAIAPDGSSVYVAAYSPGTLAGFSRDQETGALAASGCFAGQGDLSDCEQDHLAVDSPNSVVVSPDGESVYATSYANDAVAIFARDPESGALSDANCVSDTNDFQSNPPPSCDRRAEGLEGVTSIAISPDGGSVYSISSKALVRYSRTDDTDPPETTIESGPTGGQPTNDVTPSWTFASDEPGSTFECRILEPNESVPPFDECSGPASHESPESLDDGPFTFEVRATDPNLNNDPDPAAGEFTIDTQKPVAVIHGPHGSVPINDPNPTWTFRGSEEGVSFECSLVVRDDAPPETFGPCSGPGDSHSPDSPLADGSYTFSVRATDRAGNVQWPPSEYNVKIDTVAPTTTVEDGPGGGQAIADPAPVWEFDHDEGVSRTDCRVYRAGQAPAEFSHCSGQREHQPDPALADGDYVFEVRATDWAGNVEDPVVTRGFTVDTVAPNAGITSGPADGSYTGAQPSWGFSSNEPGSAFECRVTEAEKDPGAFGACSDPEGAHQPSEPLGDGSYAFEVAAVDAAGNRQQAPASRTFVVDTSGPVTTIDSGPAGSPTNDTTPTWTFSSGEEGSTFECKVGSGDAVGTQTFAPCSGPGQSHTPPNSLSDGAKTFSVRATDQAGNVDADPAQVEFEIDTASPETTVESGPVDGKVLNDPAPSWRFSVNEDASAIECRVTPAGESPAGFSPCSGPSEHQAEPALADGDYLFEVRASDLAGNIELPHGGHLFSIDTVEPTATITSGPGDGALTGPTPSWSFVSDEPGSQFECSISAMGEASSRELGECSDPDGSHEPREALADGAYRLKVAAVDRAGNRQEAPATRDFIVDTTGPVTTISSGPVGITTSDPTPTWTFGASELGTFECRILGDGAFAQQFGRCLGAEGSHTGRPLEDGAYRFEVRSNDSAGNVEAEPPFAAFEVDTILIDPRVEALSPQGVGRRVKVSGALQAGEAFVSELTGRLIYRLKRKRLVVRLEPVRFRGEQAVNFQIGLPRGQAMGKRFKRALGKARPPKVKLFAVLEDATGNRGAARATVKLRSR